MKPTSKTLVALFVLTALIGTLAGCGSKTATQDRGTTSIGGVGTGGVAVTPGVPADTSGANNYGKGESAGSVTSPSGQVASDKQMIISTRSLLLEVKSTASAVDAIRAMATRYSAVITDLQVATDTDQWLYRYDQNGNPTSGTQALRGWVTLRVPAARLDALTAEAAKLGTVKNQTESANDVTQEHVDLVARLDNLRAEEARLRTFFDKAKTVSDMLAIENELNRVRGDIESLDAQVKYLERQTAMATITIELTEKKPVVRPVGDNWGFTDAITAGFRGAANVVAGIIEFLIASAPLWLLGLAIFFIVRAILRSVRHKRHTPPDAPEGTDEDV